ncbi:MAG: hypothetical protein ACR2OV_11440, partial [Hyphomicrobiaceae bacterium]
MAQSVDQQIKEDLAQLGIRKGSRFWPILAIIVAAILSFLFLPHGEPLQERFQNACDGAKGRAIAPGLSIEKNWNKGFDADRDGAAIKKIEAEETDLGEKLKSASGATKAALEKKKSELTQKKGKHEEAVRWAEAMARMGAGGRRLLALCIKDKSDEAAETLKDDIDRDFNRSPTSENNSTFHGVGARAKADIYQILTTKTVVPNAAELPSSHPPKGINEHRQKGEDKRFGDDINDALEKSNWSGAAALVLPLAADTARHLIRDLYYDFTDRLVELFVAIGLVGLISVIPGLIGMIYRRNFWSWFLLPFGALLIVTLWARFGVDQTSGALLILFLAQLGVLLLILRLRRYSNSDSQIPMNYFNYGLAGILLLIAADWFVAGFV